MGFFTYWYRKQLKKDLIQMTTTRSSNLDIVGECKDLFFKNLQRLNELFHFLTNKNTKTAPKVEKKRKLILIGQPDEEEYMFLDQVYEQFPGSNKSVLFFNSFDSVQCFFNCLFETDSEIQTQKYISNFSFYFLGSANKRSHLEEIIKFFYFFEKYNFTIKLYIRQIYFKHLDMFSSFSSFFSIKNLQFFEFNAFINLFMMSL